MNKEVFWVVAGWAVTLILMAIIIFFVPPCDGTNCERPVAIYHCDGDCGYALLLGEILADFALSIKNASDTCMKIDIITTSEFTIDWSDSCLKLLNQALDTCMKIDTVVADSCRHGFLWTPDWEELYEQHLKNCHSDIDTTYVNCTKIDSCMKIDTVWMDDISYAKFALLDTGLVNKLIVSNSIPKHPAVKRTIHYVGLYYVDTTYVPCEGG